MSSHNQRITILENASTININATAPIKYTGSTISADFGNAPQSGSNLFLNSGTISDALDTKINTSAIKQDLISDVSTNVVASVPAIISALATKQNNLTIQQTITPSTTEVASSTAIIAYVGSAMSSITATAPLVYSGGIISGTFDIAPSNGSNNFLNSDRIYDALSLKQNKLTIQTSLTNSSTAVASASAIISALDAKQNTITPTTSLDTGAVNITGNLTTSGNIQGAVITGDIFGNLDAGSGITLTPNMPPNGKTRISAAVNAFSTSTEYAFQATSDQAGDQIVSPGVRLNFNSRTIVKPAEFVDAYSNIERHYVIQSSGTYIFGVKAFIQGQPASFRIGIVKTGSGGTIAMGGGTGSMTETFTVMAECLVGETVRVEGVVGSASIFMGAAHSWFYGYKLQPETNTIGASTDLTVKNVITDDMRVTGTLTAPNIEGFTKSTEYAFQVTSNQASNQSITAGTVLNFNLVQDETPASTATEGFMTSSNRYYIPVSGYYQFGFKAHIQNASDGDITIGLFKNGSLVGFGGRFAAMTEDFTVIINCVKGQYIDLRGFSGAGTVYMSAAHTWFWGHKLTPANNLITSTTDLTVKNLTATDNLITADLAVSSSITGDTNINISGNIQTSGIVSGTTITGNIASNLSAGNNIDLSTTANITTITNTAPYEAPISRIYSRLQSAPETPSGSSLLYYTTFNTATSAVSPHVTFVAPNINTGGADTGFIIQTAGTYRISYTICVHSVSYTNRVMWRTRLLKNGLVQEVQTFIYTRGDDTEYVQYGSASTTAIVTLAVDDYLQLVTLVAKNSPLFNNNFSGLQGYDGSQFVIELLS
jgi:hypothetical protein